jgi:hypothetical protein
LAERIVERVVDELRREPEPADDVAVELEHQARRGGLEIAGHVLQLWQRFDPTLTPSKIKPFDIR